MRKTCLVFKTLPPTFPRAKAPQDGQTHSARNGASHPASKPVLGKTRATVALLRARVPHNQLRLLVLLEGEVAFFAPPTLDVLFLLAGVTVGGVSCSLLAKVVGGW